MFAGSDTCYTEIFTIPIREHTLNTASVHENVQPNRIFGMADVLCPAGYHSRPG